LELWPYYHLGVLGLANPTRDKKNLSKTFKTWKDAKRWFKVLEKTRGKLSNRVDEDAVTLALGAMLAESPLDVDGASIKGELQALFKKEDDIFAPWAGMLLLRVLQTEKKSNEVSATKAEISSRFPAYSQEIDGLLAQWQFRDAMRPS
jgi:hypothetical protein